MPIAKYKTFRAHLGFYDTIVAAPSMQAAIDACDAPANIFAQGFAARVDDPAMTKIAQSKPRVVFKRLSGTKGAFLPDPQWAQFKR